MLVYSDEGVLATGAASLLSTQGQFDVFLAEPELSSLIPHAERIKPDLILLGLNSSMTMGFITSLRECVPNTRIILWDRQFSEELIGQARDLGGFCFLQRGRSGEEFLHSITGIAAGESPADQSVLGGATKINLTPREAQLITLLVQGLRNKEIAACLSITEGTVRIYLTKLFIKVGARDRFELAVFGLKNLNCGYAFWDGLNGFVTEADQDRARPALRSLVLVEPGRRRGYRPLAHAVGD